MDGRTRHNFLVAALLLFQLASVDRTAHADSLLSNEIDDEVSVESVDEGFPSDDDPASGQEMEVIDDDSGMSAGSSDEDLEASNMDPDVGTTEASRPHDSTDPGTIERDPENLGFQESIDEIIAAAEPLSNAVQPVVDAAESGFGSDEFIDGANEIVSPIVGFGAKVSKPFVQVGSKVAAPFVKLGAKVAAPFVKLKAKVAKAKSVIAGVGVGLKAKFLKPKAKLLAPAVKTAIDIAGPAASIIKSPNAGKTVPEVDVDPMEKFDVVLSGNAPRPVDVDEEIEEVLDGEEIDEGSLEPIVDSLRPLSVATRPLSDAVQPIVDAVNVPVPATFREISQDVAGFLEPAAKAAAPIVSVKSNLAAPFVKLGAKAVAPVVKFGAKLAKKKAAAILIPATKVVEKVKGVGRLAKESIINSAVHKGFSSGFSISKTPGGPLDFGLGGGAFGSVGGFAEGVEEIETVDLDTVEEVSEGEFDEPVRVAADEGAAPAPVVLLVEPGGEIIQAVNTEGETVSLIVLDTFGNVLRGEELGSGDLQRERREVIDLTNQFGGPIGDASSSSSELLLGTFHTQAFTNYGGETSEVVTLDEDQPYKAHPQSRRKPYRPPRNKHSEKGGKVPVENVEIRTLPAKTPGTSESGPREATKVTSQASTKVKKAPKVGPLPTEEGVEFIEEVDKVQEAEAETTAKAPAEAQAPVTPPKCESEFTYMTTSMCHRVEEYSVTECGDACGSEENDLKALIDMCKKPMREQMCKYMVKPVHENGGFGSCKMYAFKFFRLFDYSSFCRHQIKCAVDNIFCKRWV